MLAEPAADTGAGIRWHTLFTCRQRARCRLPVPLPDAFERRPIGPCDAGARYGLRHNVIYEQRGSQPANETSLFKQELFDEFLIY